MYSPAEEPHIEAFLEDQLGKRNSHDEAWTETERKFGVIRPVLGDAANVGAGVTIASEKPDWDAIADQEGGLDYQKPARVAKRDRDAAEHRKNNFLSGVMSEARKPVQQAINARRPQMPWEK